MARMQRSHATAVLLLALAAPAAAAEERAQSTVLTSNNFEELVGASDERWLVEFYAPWCAHCKKLAPVWKQAAEVLAGKLRFGTVDATVEKALAKRFDIRGYPTVKLIHNGRHRTYEGDKTVLGFAEYAARMAGPPVHELPGVAELRASLGPARRAFVLAGPPAALPPGLAEAFGAVADDRHDVLTFARLDDAAAPAQLLAIGAGTGARAAAAAAVAAAEAAAAARAAVAGAPALVGVVDGDFFEPFAPPAADSGGPAELEASLRAWVEARELPSVVTVTSANFWKLKKLTQPPQSLHVALAVLDPSDLPAARAQQAQMAAHALDHRGAVQFGWVDGTEMSEYWRSEYGIERSALPTVLVLAAKSAVQGSSDDHHWRARNGTQPLAGAAEQASFLGAIVAGELAPERSGTPFSLFGVLKTAWVGVKAFATSQPLAFCGCVGLNLLFLASLALGVPGDSPRPRAAPAAKQD